MNGILACRTIFATPWQHRELLIAMIKREVLGRYRGSILGGLWSFLNHRLMLLVYTFLFSVLFKMRWPGVGNSRAEFALRIFAWMIVFNLFSECVSRAPGLVVSNPGYVKKVDFPLEILPWVNLGTALFHAGVSLLVWLLFYMLFIGMPRPSLLKLPVALMPLIPLTLGSTWLLASLGVFLRDIALMVEAFMSALLFLSAVFYPIGALPESYQALLYLDPLAMFIEHARSLVFEGNFSCWPVWGSSLLGALIIASLGLWWFQKTRKGFGDVL